MRVLPMDLLNQIQRFDPTVDVFWNQRIFRWVVAQKVNTWERTSNQLKGVHGFDQEKCLYIPVFVCELQVGDDWEPGAGMAKIPGPWIIERLAKLKKFKHQGEAGVDKMMADDDAKQAKAFDDDLTAMTDEMKGDLLRHGGIGDYSHDDVLAKKYVVISDGKAER